MDYFYCFVSIAILSFFDLFVEYFYQLVALFNFDGFIKSYPRIRKTILDDHLRVHLQQSISHNLVHLTVHTFLIAISLASLALVFKPLLHKGAYDWSKYVLFAFHEISAFEMLLLQTECCIIRYFESKWIWDLLVPQRLAYSFAWLVFLLCFWSPAEIRFKVFLEEQLHYNAVVVIGLIHAFAVFIFPYIRLFVAVKLHDSKVIKLNTAALPNVPNTQNVSLVLLPNNGKHQRVSFVNFFYKNYVLVEGHQESDLSELTVCYLFESYHFNTFYKLCHALSPFFVNMLFAALMIYLNKHVLEDIHIHSVHHITLYLLFEEFFNVGLLKYLYIPYRAIEKLLIAKNDTVVKQYLNSCDSSEKSLHYYLEHELDEHKAVCTSPISSFFTDDVNSLNRIEEVLNK